METFDASASSAGLSSKIDLLQLVTFNIGGEEFGVDILKVREINRMMDVTRVPNSPYYVEGVINLRGKVIPVIDLRKRFSMESRQSDKATRIVVVEVEGKTLGFIVDSVSEVLRIPSDTVEPPPPFVTDDADSHYINGVGKLNDRLLIMLDLERLFDNQLGNLQPKETERSDEKPN